MSPNWFWHRFMKLATFPLQMQSAKRLMQSTNLCRFVSGFAGRIQRRPNGYGSRVGSTKSATATWPVSLPKFLFAPKDEESMTIARFTLTSSR